MANHRRSFSDEFKLDAVRRVASGEHSLTYVARELGIHPSLLQHWRRKFTRTGTLAMPDGSLEEEVRRLRRENAARRDGRASYYSEWSANGSPLFTVETLKLNVDVPPESINRPRSETEKVNG